MARPMHYLTLPQLLNLAQRLGADEVRDYGSADSAGGSAVELFVEDAYPDVWHKAAALMESLAVITHWSTGAHCAVRDLGNERNISWTLDSMWTKRSGSCWMSVTCQTSRLTAPPRPHRMRRPGGAR